MAGQSELVLTHPTPAVSDAVLAQAPLELSDHEERIWLAAQQDSDASHAHVLTYRIKDGAERLDCARLATALARLSFFMPALAMLYSFDDDASLRKFSGTGNVLPIEISRINSSHDAAELIGRRQADAWNLEEEPPFRALLLLGEAESFMTLIVHRIVDESCPIEHMLQLLAALYNGDAPPPGVARRVVAEIPGQAPLLPWAMGKQAHTQVSDMEASRAHFPNAARTYKAVLNPASLTEPVDIADSRDVLATVATLWGHFLCKSGGHPKITMTLPGHPRKHIGEPGWNADVSAIADWPVNTSRQVTALRQALKNTPTPENHGQPSAGLPRTIVNWLTGPDAHFPIRGVKVERFASPVLEALPELTLGVGLDAARQIVLELTTGQNLSPHVGGFLLEQFIDFTTTSHVALPLHAAESAIFTPQKAASRSDTDHITAIILTEFRDALASPEMGPNDDFFDHGGHSLIATRIIGRLLGNHGIEVHFTDLFSYPTAASLAANARLAEQAEDGASAAPADSDVNAPLSLAQKSLWKIYSAFDFNEIFNIPFALDFLDPVDERSFESAFTDILERHPGLRSLFVHEGDAVFQRVVPVYDLPRYKWFWTSEESRGVDPHMEAGHIFDLANELPIRLRFLTDAETGRQTLSFLFHHIVLDEWSVNLMMDELVHAYRARMGGAEPVWKETPAPFHQFAQLQESGGVNTAHLEYWTNMLRDAPKGLPVLETAPAELTEEPSLAGGWVELKLEQPVCDGLYQRAKQSSASLFNVAYAAIAATLHRLGSLTDLVIGTSASGRTDPAFFDTIGYFTTVVAHRIRFSDTMTVAELITAVRDTVNGSMPYTEIPIDLVEEALGMQPGRDHLFEVFIQIHAKNKLNGALQASDGHEIRFRQIDPDKQESLLGLQFEVMEEMIDEQREIRIMMSYRADHYSPEQVELLRSATSRTLAFFAGAGSGGKPLADIR